MPKLVALRPLFGDYGRKHPGQTFEVDEQTALSLESRGLAERQRDVGLLAKMFARYENKLVVPPENKQEPPPVEVSEDRERAAVPPLLVPERRPRGRR